MRDGPEVTMLWESVEPGAALTKRFGFVDAGVAASWIAEVVGSQWAIEIDRCDRLVISGWNVLAWVAAGDRRLVAKWSAIPTKFARLRDAATITTFVQSHGLPVAAPIPPSHGGDLLVELRNEARGRARARLPLPGSRFLLGLLPVVDGELLDVDDPSQILAAARTLATLHEALAAYPHRLAGAARLAERAQLVHNDFRSSNLLQDGARICAVLDFEEITYDTRVADLAKATVYLATRYRDWGPMRPEARAAFVSAYDDCAPLTGPERDELERRIAAGLKERSWS